MATNCPARRPCSGLGERSEQNSDKLNVDSGALLSALQGRSGRSGAAAHAHRIGGIDLFTEKAKSFLRKDIAACREAATEAYRAHFLGEASQKSRLVSILPSRTVPTEAPCRPAGCMIHSTANCSPLTSAARTS